ncbi:P-type conjugative transfer protein VirB9 [Microvirga tunisiensis]|uniref:P-type conjugative transfer protein VirB9 n=1 Tax=Microvirga tunisiensis TaxID=2108360 RepID=A0A5N7MJG5_9HYPH|nr:P-type conjugative transfer protein VirB9 [Microvirga tunisiensis]MPR08860.1 P-type conjugative transfer protein VirB9 [Microvirga tunisiensis]MPR27043.1 P-type conjugative transfer protein VirB9 [Microvirga tunisiensis]
MKQLLLPLAALLALSSGASAELVPTAVRADQRIRTVTYHKDNVVSLAGTLGVSTMIVFGEDEQIATVAMGDSVSWQAVPDKSKSFLFIKPLERDAVTNMNVVTNKRIYNFLLKAGASNNKDMTFKLRFEYPDDIVDARLLEQARRMAAMPNFQQLKRNAANANLDYGFKGSRLNVPQNIFDDGVKTYFTFAGEVPGIFLVNPDGTESLINHRREGEVIVVDKVAAQWTLRANNEATCVFNLRAQPAEVPQSMMTPVQPQVQMVGEPAPAPAVAPVLKAKG